MIISCDIVFNEFQSQQRDFVLVLTTKYIAQKMNSMSWNK
jgi:hypothetical protein